MQFRFTLRELFATMTLIALGVGGLVIAFRESLIVDSLLGLLVAITAPVLICIGAAIPFQQRRGGCFAGGAISLVLLLAGMSSTIGDGRTQLTVVFAVVDKESHRPVAGAVIDKFDPDDWLGTPRTTHSTDEDGRVVLTTEVWISSHTSYFGLYKKINIQIPSWCIEVAADGYHLSGRFFLPHKERGNHAQCDGPGKSHLNVEIELAPK